MKTNYLMTFVLLSALLLSGCNSGVRVGELRTESKSVDLGNDQSVRVKIAIGAGKLSVTGDSEKLLEADFTYNVDKLKPEVKYTDGSLLVQHPDVNGLGTLGNITDFRNEWNLRLSNQVPMDLSVEMGAGTSDLQLAGLSLTRFNVSLGAGESTVNLSGDWLHDFDVTIDAGAGSLILKLPRDIGVRIRVETGLGTIDASGLMKDGSVYTNAAYGVSEVTLQIDLQAGLGQIILEVEA